MLTVVQLGLVVLPGSAHADEPKARSNEPPPAAELKPKQKPAPPVDPRSDLASEKARVLFQRGRELAADSRFSEACESFERSLSFEHAIGTEFNLADCFEHLGRIASAQELFTEVALRAHADGQNERERVARERAAALEPRLSRLVIAPTVARPGLQIRRNGLPVERALWGKALAVDPGSYDIDASVGAGTRWHQRVEVAGPRATVWVLVPSLTAGAETLEEPDAPRQLRARPPTAAPAPRSVLDWKRAGPIVVGLSALGVAGLAAGTAFALKYQSNNDQAKDLCRLAVCTADDIAHHDQLASNARASRTGAFLSFGVAGASLIGAAAVTWGPWWRKEKAPSAWKAAPVLGADRTWGVAAEGSF